MDVLTGRARRLAGVLALAVAACDPLIDGAYRGEPLFSFEGQLVQFDGLAEQGYPIRTTLLWLTDPSVDPGTLGPRLASAVEQPSAAVALRFPSEFRLDVYAPPDDTMLVPGTGLGVALVVVYEDRDRNGRLTWDSRPSELVGGAPYDAIVYARDAAAAARAPFQEAIAAGFQLVRIPLFCDEGAIAPTCTGPLGEACEDATDCGDLGLCLRELDGVVWPGGACSYAAETATCTPDVEASGVYVDDAGGTYVIAYCELPEDCRAGYRCDDFYLGCVPEAAPDLGAERAPLPPREADLPECAVTLGAPCVVDADCGPAAEGAVCLVRSGGELFPNGYCAVVIPSDSTPACAPRDGRRTPWDYTEDGRDTHWLRACTSESDCRGAEGYTCDVWLEACLPVSPVGLELAPDFAPSPVCYGGFGRGPTR